MAGDSGVSQPIVVGVNKPHPLSFMMRALHSRNYRLFFSGQFVSLIGTWLTSVATSWLVNRITNDPIASPKMLGYVNFAALMPAFLLGPIAGVMVDRWRKHRLLLWTQALSMLQSCGLAIVAFTLAGPRGQPPPHTVTVILCWLIGLMMMQGFINAFDIPARQSLVVKLVKNREDLPNAIALNSSMFNAARLVGPAVAGVLIWKVGEAWCFTIDGLSYLAVLVALLMMRVNEEDRPRVHRHVLIEFREGLSYAMHSGPIRSILLLLAVVSFATTPITILMPRFATEVLHGDARTQGLLTSAIAVGALLGAIQLAARKSIVGLGRQMPWVTAGLGVSIAMFGCSTTRWLSLPALVGVGYGMMTQMASGNTMLQTIVEDSKRGRVMSLFTMAVMGMMPLGSIASGELAARIGAPRTAMAGAVICVGAALFFAFRLPALRAQLRPIYIERGIIPGPVPPPPST